MSAVSKKPVKFAYWIPNVSGGLVVSKITQRTNWDIGYNRKLAQIAERAGFEYGLTQVRFTAGYGADNQHESVAFSQALLDSTEKLKVIAALLPGPWNPTLEVVHKPVNQAYSLLNITLLIARYMKLSVDVVSKSYSFDSLLFLLIQAKVLSTTHLLGCTENPGSRCGNSSSGVSLCTQNLHGGLLTISISIPYSLFT